MMCACPSPSPAHSSATTASEWVQRFTHLLAPHSRVLDVACGSGRHAAYLAARGHRVIGIDRDADALARLPNSVQAVHADIENGPWPQTEGPFDAVLVTHYLWRPLWPQILASVRPGGLLIYETFAQGNEAFGKPSRPDFLLAPGELLQVCAGWHIVAYEHGERPSPQRMLQRIVALRPDPASTQPPSALLA